MGNLKRKPVSPFVNRLKNRYNLNTLVETGTYLGESTKWAANNFNHVISIEINPDFHLKSKHFLKKHENVNLILGDSAIVLGDVVNSLQSPALFWLDGHAGGGNYGNEEICPVMQELKAIKQSEHDHFIFIDDARAFYAPPPPPFKPNVWPSIDQIIRNGTKKNYYCAIMEDIIMLVPRKAKKDIIKFCNKVRPTI